MSKKIAMVGGGSVSWSPTLISDFLYTKEIEDAQYILLDIDEEAGEKMARLGRATAEKRGLKASFDSTSNPKEAYIGADFVIITISTGDLDAMEYDIQIPEEYKIYQTVGDTVGPGGWARALRNIPMFAQMAKDIEHYSPNAVVLNYTNPLSVLTNVFYKVSRLKTVGLCHGLLEVYDLLRYVSGLKDDTDIKLRFGGVNHFFWILSMAIRGEDGYSLLRKEIKQLGKGLDQLIPEAFQAKVYPHANSMVCDELFRLFGYLPYSSDRHTCEFIPGYINGGLSNIQKYKLVRTSIAERRAEKKNYRTELDQYLSGEKALPDVRSRELAASIISAMISGKEYIDVLNLPNRGQIGNLPRGTVVETLGVVNNLGFTPMAAGELPENILNLILPHAHNQNLLAEAGIEGDYDKAFYALYNDPACSHLTFTEKKEMGERLLRAHKQYLPQFSLL